LEITFLWGLLVFAKRKRPQGRRLPGGKLSDADAIESPGTDLGGMGGHGQQVTLLTYPGSLCNQKFAMLEKEGHD
jgi:hypothetical protein